MIGPRLSMQPEKKWRLCKKHPVSGPNNLKSVQTVSVENQRMSHFPLTKVKGMKSDWSHRLIFERNNPIVQSDLSEIFYS